MIEEPLDFKGRKDHWDLHFQLQHDLLSLHLHSEQTMETFTAEVNADKIK